MSTADAADTSLHFTPKLDRDGLVTAVVVDAATSDVLMVAWMNETALSETLATGEAHFWSRSRAKIWKKGEESGNVLKVVEARVDCDQDTLLLRVETTGAGVACHTGRRSCFYRSIPLGPGPVTDRALHNIER
jgi:phosphoribosyl-AMP cyclohydrolase